MSRTLTNAKPGIRHHAGCAAIFFQLLKGECGNDLIEYALCILVFLTLLFGITGFGQALYAYHFVSNAAREATRYAAVRGYTCNGDSSCSVATPDSGPAAPGNTVIQDYVATIVPPDINPNNVKVQPNWPVQTDSPAVCSQAVTGFANSPYPNYPGCTVEVQVSYTFNFVFPLISTASVPMSSTSEMVITH